MTKPIGHLAYATEMTRYWDVLGLAELGNQTALVVVDGDIRVVSEGDWLLFNAETDQEDT